MAQLIEMVAGGYMIIETEKVIPPVNLVPFGILHSFPGHTEDKVRNLEKFEEMKIEEIKEKANEYANEMRAPFYELQVSISNNYRIKFLTGRMDLKKVPSFAEAKIQLYVRNT